MSNLTKRVLVALIGIPLAIFVIWMGSWYFFILILLLNLQMQKELFSFFATKDLKINQPLAYLLNIALHFIVYSHQFLDEFGMLISIFLFVFILIFSSFLMVMFDKESKPLQNIMIIPFSLIYPTMAFISLYLIRELDSYFQILDYQGQWLVFAIFVAVWTGDSLAYFTGRAIGKRKLWERLSPKKTWEGAIANLIGSALGFYLVIHFSEINHLTISLTLIMGLLIGILGQLGDLAESILKRDSGLKDSSNILPGHGGLLDRFDSILFSAPPILIMLLFIYSQIRW